MLRGVLMLQAGKEYTFSHVQPVHAFLVTVSLHAACRGTCAAHNKKCLLQRPGAFTRGAAPCRCYSSLPTIQPTAPAIQRLTGGGSIQPSTSDATVVAMSTMAAVTSLTLQHREGRQCSVRYEANGPRIWVVVG